MFSTRFFYYVWEYSLNMNFYEFPVTFFSLHIFNTRKVSLWVRMENRRQGKYNFFSLSLFFSLSRLQQSDSVIIWVPVLMLSHCVEQVYCFKRILFSMIFFSMYFSFFHKSNFSFCIVGLVLAQLKTCTKKIPSLHRDENSFKVQNKFRANSLVYISCLFVCLPL